MTTLRRSRRGVEIRAHPIVKCSLDYCGGWVTFVVVLDQAASAERVFFALGDASRRAIVDQLSRGPASVKVLAEPLDITLAAVLQHVQILERCGLLTTHKVGRTRTCRLARHGLDTAERWIALRRQQWERRLDRLGEIVDGESVP